MRDATTGVVTREEYRVERKLHRQNGPASIERDHRTGVVVREAYLGDGDLS